MTGSPTGAPIQLLVYRLAPGTTLEGQLVGALERLEAGASIRVLDALFVRADAETGEIEVFEAAGEGPSSVLVGLLDPRLDAQTRRRVSRRTFDGGVGGIPAPQLRELVRTLPPGAGLAAVLVEHVWTRTLDDAIEHVGGAAILSRFVDASALADVTADLQAAAHRA